MPLEPIPCDDLKKALPLPWQPSLNHQIQELLKSDDRKVIVLDDDPTGTQTVQDVFVYTHWDDDAITDLFQEQDRTAYILTNSRNLAPPDAYKLATEIGNRLQRISLKAGREYSVISRSDSTLRGHFPDEVDGLLEGMQTDCDAVLLAPCFFEGGRITFNNTHWLGRNDRFIPVDRTEFALDPVFGYRTSNLQAWIEEKTKGKTKALDVKSVSLELVRNGGPDAVCDFLMRTSRAEYVVINAVDYTDLDVVVLAILKAEALGKRFIFRTAASFVKARGGIPAIPCLSGSKLVNQQGTSRGGIMVVGSYVPLTTAQVNHLLSKHPFKQYCLDIEEIIAKNPRTISSLISHGINEDLSAGINVILFTSREFVTSQNDTFFKLGQKIMDELVKIVKHISVSPRFFIAKGGITSSDIATRGIGIRKARVLGQAMPGVPVWECGSESKFPGMPYVIFPGNVGEEGSLASLVHNLNS